MNRLLLAARQRRADFGFGGVAKAGGDAGDCEGGEEAFAFVREDVLPSGGDALLDDRDVAHDLPPFRRSEKFDVGRRQGHAPRVTVSNLTRRDRGIASDQERHRAGDQRGGYGDRGDHALTHAVVGAVGARAVAGDYFDRTDSAGVEKLETLIAVRRGNPLLMFHPVRGLV